jgi:ribosomal protein S1
VVRESDTVRLVVLSVDPSQRRISFSLKQAGPDPWKSVHERYATHTIVSGTVTRLADFGALVELEPGLEGIVHVSELADNRVRSAAEVVKIGQDIKVLILEIDQENRRMSLSLKRAAGSARSSAEVPAAKTAATKKKRPQLRGGLDF